jgi:hypothetical protein
MNLLNLEFAMSTKPYYLCEAVNASVWTRHAIVGPCGALNAPF